MAKKATKGETTRSETISVRIEPKIKYGLELLSRKQHRTLAGVVEWALERVLKDPEAGLSSEFPYTERELSDKTSEQKQNLIKRYKYDLDRLWDWDEVIRFINLVYYDKALLNYEEEALWSLITQNSAYWLGTHSKGDTFLWDVGDSSYLQVNKVTADWHTLKQIIAGEKSTADLPEWSPCEIRYENKRSRTISAEPLPAPEEILTEDDYPF